MKFYHSFSKYLVYILYNYVYTYPVAFVLTSSRRGIATMGATHFWFRSAEPSNNVTHTYFLSFRHLLPHFYYFFYRILVNTCVASPLLLLLFLLQCTLKNRSISQKKNLLKEVYTLLIFCKIIKTGSHMFVFSVSVLL